MLLVKGVQVAKKIDPLNKKQFSAVSAALTVSDVTAAANFYQKAFGFAKRSIMKGPDGKPIHAVLTLRGTTVMLDHSGWKSAAILRWVCVARRVSVARPRVYIYTWKM